MLSGRKKREEGEELRDVPMVGWGKGLHLESFRQLPANSELNQING